MSTSTTEGRAGLGAFWAARSRRERLLLGLAAAVLLLAALVQLGIRPAWQRLQSAPQEQARLDAQWQQMQALQAQSAALRRQPRRAFDEAALRRSLAPLGDTAALELAPGRAQLRLQGARPDALAAWLVQARAQAGVGVAQAQLQREQQGGQVLWKGLLVLELPP